MLLCRVLLTLLNLVVKVRCALRYNIHVPARHSSLLFELADRSHFVKVDKVQFQNPKQAILSSHGEHAYFSETLYLNFALQECLYGYLVTIGASSKKLLPIQCRLRLYVSFNFKQEVTKKIWTGCLFKRN